MVAIGQSPEPRAALHAVILENAADDLAVVQHVEILGHARGVGAGGALEDEVVGHPSMIITPRRLFSLTLVHIGEDRVCYLLGLRNAVFSLGAQR